LDRDLRKAPEVHWEEVATGEQGLEGHDEGASKKGYQKKKNRPSAKEPFSIKKPGVKRGGG